MAPSEQVADVGEGPDNGERATSLVVATKLGEIEEGRWVVEKTAQEQGLPICVEDSSVISEIAILLTSGRAPVPAHARQIGWTRSGSKRFRPRTAELTTIRGRTALMMARCRAGSEVRTTAPGGPPCRRRTRRAPRRLKGCRAAWPPPCAGSSMGRPGGHPLPHADLSLAVQSWPAARARRRPARAPAGRTSASSSTERARDTARCSLGESSRWRTASATKRSRGSDEDGHPATAGEAGPLGAEVAALRRRHGDGPPCGRRTCRSGRGRSADTA